MSWQRCYVDASVASSSSCGIRFSVPSSSSPLHLLFYVSLFPSSSSLLPFLTHLLTSFHDLLSITSFIVFNVRFLSFDPVSISLFTSVQIVISKCVYLTWRKPFYQDNSTPSPLALISSLLPSIGRGFNLHRMLSHTRFLPWAIILKHLALLRGFQSGRLSGPLCTTRELSTPSDYVVRWPLL